MFETILSETVSGRSPSFEGPFPKQFRGAGQEGKFHILGGGGGKGANSVVNTHVLTAESDSTAIAQNAETNTCEGSQIGH